MELLNNLGHDPIISETSAVIDSAINAQRKDDVDNSKKLKLKVLLKEKTFEVFCADNATVLQLKEEISSQTDIPAIQQRLIFSGRQLKPDEKLLSSFKIICNSPIHLFPLPSAQAIAAPEVPSILIVLSKHLKSYFFHSHHYYYECHVYITMYCMEPISTAI